VTIRWGVLGAGGIADRRTIPEGITQATDAQLVAVMDVDRGRAQAVGENRTDQRTVVHGHKTGGWIARKKHGEILYRIC
jgi:hypothetical protein